MECERFKPGDWAVYRKQKTSKSPGPRALQTMPAAKGETYNYFVDKFWVVEQLLGDGRLGVRTARGKQIVIASTDPQLRKPNWWQRWRFGGRFRAVQRAIDGLA